MTNMHPVGVNRPLAARAVDDAKTDTAFADEYLAASDSARLHSLCLRLIDDRKKIAEAFNAVMVGWNMMRDSPDVLAPSSDSMKSLEKVATEAIDLAKTVVQAFIAKAN